MEAVEDVCESEGVCEVMCYVPSDEPQHEESMETHVSAEEATLHANSGSVEEYTDFPGAVDSNTEMSTEPPKPRFSYRLETFQKLLVYLFINLGDFRSENIFL